MKNILKSLNKEKPIIVGVSGGPDSMALLDMLYQEGFVCYVVHVNYKVRDSADRDQSIVEQYCKDKSIIYYVFDDFKMTTGNFQTNARNYRYQKYKEIYDKTKANGLYLGHHLDDHLETIVFQLMSNRTPHVMGIRKQSMVNEMKVYRPLLDRSKEFLIDYCHCHGIDYGIDESNLSKKYSRNKIRQLLKRMDDKNKQELLVYATEYDKTTQQKLKQVQAYIKDKKILNINEYAKFELSDRIMILREFLIKQQVLVYSLSRAHLISLDKKILSRKSGTQKLNNSQFLLVEYDTVSINMVKNYEFSVVFDTIYYMHHEHFTSSDKKIDDFGVTVSSSDFPITIRNAKNGDKITMRYGTKKLSRFFIDRKIPYLDRLSWPVIENKDKQVIFVCELGCDKDHYSHNHNLYVTRKK